MQDSDVVSGRGFRRRLAAFQHGAEGLHIPDSSIVRALKVIDRTLDVRWHHTGVSATEGCWAVWKMTRRYVPQGTWGGTRFWLAMDVPQLVGRARPGLLTHYFLEGIRKNDLHKVDRMKMVDEWEKEEAAPTRAAEANTEAVARDAWGTWHLQETPHIYVPKSYGN